MASSAFGRKLNPYRRLVCERNRCTGRRRGWKALRPLRGTTGGCHDKNSGARGYTAVHERGQYVSPYSSREPAAALGGPRVRPVCRPRAQQHCLRIILSLREASGADHRGADHGEVLPIWTPMPKAYRRRWTRETAM